MTLSSREKLGFAVQTVVGTPVAPDKFIPVAPGSFRAGEEFEQILDQGRRGVDALDFAAVQGVGITNVAWDGNVAQNNTDKMTLGYLLDNLLGANSTATVLDTTNYDHYLKLGTTKEYLTLEHVLLRGTTVDRRIPACRVTELVIRYNAGEGAVTYSVTLMGRKIVKVEETVVDALTDSEGELFEGWQAEAMLTGSGAFTPDTAARLLSAEFTLRRSSDPFYASIDSQDFADLYLGPLEVTAALVLDYSAVTELDYLRNKTQGSLAVRFLKGTVDTATERSFSIGGSLFDWGDGPAELDSSGSNVRLQIAARGLYTVANGPFSGAAQNGPVEVHIAQPVAAAY